MKLEKVVSFLWSCALSFAVSFASVACLVTGMSMAVELETVALWCATGAVVSSICYTLPLGAIPVPAFALAAGYLWQEGSLEVSIESLLYRLSRQYDQAYGWGIIKLNMLTADDMEPTLWLSLCVIGVLITVLIAWSVCRRKPVIPGFLLALLPLGACLVVTDTLPGTQLLYLLLLGLGVLLLSNTVRRQDEAQGNRLTLIATGVVAVLLLVLFAAVPQAGYTGQARAQALADSILHAEFAENLLGRFAENGVVGTDADSNRVNLEAVGVRLESQAEVMRVKGFTDSLYLRGRSLDAYDGSSWSDSGVSTAELYWPEGYKLSTGGEVMIFTRYAHRMLYLPYYVRSMDLTDMTKGMENTKKLTQYSFSCDRMSLRDERIELYADAGSADSTQDFSQYLHLSDSVREWAEPLAQQITAGKDTVYDRAQAIGEYVRNSAEYDTNTPQMPAREEDFVRWFLEDSDTGYCVHFASAATVLLQAAGIPARYVTGYMAEVEAGEETVVRAKDAHAWTEYWLPGYGWLVLEATPADERLTDEQTQQTSVPEETQQEQTQPTQVPDTTQETKPGAQTPKPKTTAGLLTALWILAAVLAAVAAALAQCRIRLVLRRKKLCLGTSNDQALALWQETVRLARVLGQTPDKALFAIAQKAKFSQYTIQPEELQRFDRYLRETQNKLRGRSIFHQFYYRVILALY